MNPRPACTRHYADACKIAANFIFLFNFNQITE